MAAASAVSKVNWPVFIVSAVLKRAEPQLAEFAVLSPLDPNELGQRMLIGDFPGFLLKTTRVDSQAITVRYIRQGS